MPIRAGEDYNAYGDITRFANYIMSPFSLKSSVLALYLTKVKVFTPSFLFSSSYI